MSGGKPRLTPDQMLSAITAYQAAGQSLSDAARAENLPLGTFRSRLYRAWDHFGKDEKQKAIEKPSFPDPSLPVEKIIADLCQAFDRRKLSHDLKKWAAFNVKGLEPIGICWFGDPHVDDNGCNWPLLTRDCSIVAKTPGMFGANIGDSHNNWVGRLAREYANQDVSRDTAFKLIDWLFTKSGVDWLIMLVGNHDEWNDGARILKKMTQYICPMIDWRAQFRLVFSNGRECLIDAAHDHKGHSQWNPVHAQQKASSMGGMAHLYIAGHRHTWALAQHECDQSGRIYWLARCRGYKHMDHYATVNGFGQQAQGSSVVSVIDPRADDINFIRCFADVQEGAEYLTFLRHKRGVDDGRKGRNNRG